MTLALWPEAAGWADEVARARLMAAYVRRKRFEAKLMVAAVAEAMAPTTRNRISPMEMLGKLGVTL